MNPHIERAIAELEATFPIHRVEVIADGNGGANVLVHNLDVGEQYTPSKSWIGFHLNYQYPHPDVYPHFMDGSVRFVNGRGWIAGFSQTSWIGRNVIQISRRSRQWNPTVDTSATKLLKILEWLHSQ